MAFVELEIPEDLSYGSGGGPGFDIRVIQLDSGQTQRIARRNQARRRYNLVHRDMGRERLRNIKNFFLAVGGAKVGFRYHDHDDDTTASDDIAAPSATDVIIGTGDGVTAQFQLIKVYSAGAFTNTRKLTKIVTNTTRVSLDNTELPATVSGTPYTFSVNTSTGRVTITPAPANMLVVRAGCEFRVPVYFDIETDQLLNMTIEGFDLGQITDIPVIEELDPSPVSDQIFYGGSYNHGDITADIEITEVLARLHIVEPQVAGLKARLPEPEDVGGDGGPVLAIANQGTEDITATTADGVTTVLPIPPSGLGVFWVSYDGVSTYSWIGK